MKCVSCSQEVEEVCGDGFCRDCHVDLSFEDCCDGTWVARQHKNRNWKEDLSSYFKNLWKERLIKTKPGEIKVFYQGGVDCLIDNGIKALLKELGYKISESTYALPDDIRYLEFDRIPNFKPNWRIRLLKKLKWAGHYGN